jgi:hypothetical protein
MKEHPLTGEEFLTVDEVDELSNGTSSIIKMRNTKTMEVRDAVVDDAGWLRTFDRRRAYFTPKWEPVEDET